MHLARVRNEFEVSSSSARSSSAPPRQSFGNSTHIWASKSPSLTLAPHNQHQYQHTHRASHFPVSPGTKAPSSAKARTTILFVPPSPGPPPLKHPSPVRPTGPTEYFDHLPPHSSTINNTPRVAICTRKTTVKTNTITISSKPLPPRPLPTPPVIDINEYHEPESPRNEEKEGRKERLTWAAFGLDEWDLDNENLRRRATSETRNMRTPSIGSRPELNDNLNGTVDVDKRNQYPRGTETRGREMTRPSLRVQLPPPSVRTKRTPSRRDNHALEFVIHADDVIPSEAPPRTIEISERSPDASPGGYDSHLNSREGNDTPKVTLTIAGAIDWPDYLVDSFHPDIDSEPDSSSPKLKSNDPLESPTMSDDVPSGSSENNRRRPVKRKPAPPVRVHSLPIALGEADSAGAYDSATVAAQLQNLFSSDVKPDVAPPPPRTSPESSVNPKIEGDVSPLNSPNDYPVPPLLSLGFSSATLPPRSQSSPPGAADAQGQLPSLITKSKPPKLNLLGPTTKDWRTLSSLDLTACDELKIYLDSLTLIAGTAATTTAAIDHFLEPIKPVEFRLSTSSSYYPDSDVVATSARITSFSPTIYSRHSELPSPSDYIPYPSPNFKYSLVPRPISGVAELPCEIPASPNYTLPAPTPKDHSFSTNSPVINVGRLRIQTSSTDPKVQFLDVLLTAPSQTPKTDREMPCRTTILKATRRATFVRPGSLSPLPDLPGSTIAPRKNSHPGDRDRKHGSLLKSTMSINTALKVGSGKGLLNRENSRKIRGRGGTILRKRGKDIYLELVTLGILISPGSGGGEFSGYEAFLNRLDGSLWFVLSRTKHGRMSGLPAGSGSGGSSGVFDQWLANVIPRKSGPLSSSASLLKKEKIVAVRWADGLDCVDPLRGVGLLTPGIPDSTATDYNNGFKCGTFDLHMHAPGFTSNPGALDGLGLGLQYAPISPASQYSPLVARQKVSGEFEIDTPSAATELEGVEVYFGEGVEEEEDGWFVPEGYGEGY